ncbi:MAG: AbrB/MazE/SpoVT family DNA-binding domain-containing protein [Azoarcus sp.]|jgi:antitoxin ChpS|nr:AbrB/MazE/SpoVT family DNA-binding domain-containing protein [Azoarcus sp.]
MLQALRRSGGSLVMTIPKSFIEQNGLSDGSKVALRLSGSTLTVEATQRPRYNLTDLMAEMPEGYPRLEDWENMPAVGLERD